MIPYGRQSISDEDIAAVVEVLRSEFLTQGPTVPRFEAALAKKVGARHAVAVNSATSALHLACLALGVGPADRVWTSPNTFVASANCARYCAADVDFVDIDATTYNMSPHALEAKLVQAEKAGTLPKVVIPVHFSGQSCEMAEIRALSQRYGFYIIEDASHAIGASYAGGPVGDCRFSEIAVFSFHPVKIITTGEGGAATTNDAELAYRMATLRTHGITRDPSRMERKDPPAWHYEQQMLGFNYRMIDIEAALGLSQLLRVDEFVARRNNLAEQYQSLLKDYPIKTPVMRPGQRSAFHLYVIRLLERDAAYHRRVFQTLRNNGVGANVHYTPVHLQPDYSRLGFKAGMFPEAEAYAESALTIPLYPSMTESDQNSVAEALLVALA